MCQPYIEQAIGGKHTDQLEASHGGNAHRGEQAQVGRRQVSWGMGHSVVGMQVHLKTKIVRVQIIYISLFENLSVRPGGLCVSLTSQG